MDCNSLHVHLVPVTQRRYDVRSEMTMSTRAKGMEPENLFREKSPRAVGLMRRRRKRGKKEVLGR